MMPDLACGDIADLERRIALDDVVRTGDEEGGGDRDGRRDDIPDNRCHAAHSTQARWPPGPPVRGR